VAGEDLVLRENIAEQQSEFTYKDAKNIEKEISSQKPISFSTGGSLGTESGKDMFQVGGCYIVQVNSDDLTVTDQHAAHERVLYEFFSKAKESGPPETQNLLFPVVLDLSREESVIMEKMAESFKKIGFTIESFGENSFAVQTVPAILRDRDIKTVVEEALQDISALNVSKIDRVDELVKIAACRGAIKAGDKLDRSEMLSVLDHLHRCELPFTCPHGRPTTFNITIDEMERRFRRK